MRLLNVNIRPYIESDFPEVMQLIHTSIKINYPEFYPKEVVSYFLTYHSEDELKKRIAFIKTTVLVAELENKIIACGYLRKQEIGAVYVKKELQGKGIGGDIVHELIDIANNMKHDHIWLDATLGAKDFYLKMSFQLVEEMTDYVKNNVPLRYFRMFMKLKGREFKNT